ncbi:MAG: histidinol-phosphatase HisJ family protein [Christensenellales bacterium]
MWDYHLHSSCSFDSKESMMALAARCHELGILDICFTEHVDYGYPFRGDYELLDRADYARQIALVRASFPDMKIRMGIEAGMMQDSLKVTEDFIKDMPLDYVIGSVHEYREDGVTIDPYFTVFEPGSCRDVYLRYLQEMDSCLREADFYQVMGHVNYLSKIAQFHHVPMRYADAPALIDSILSTLVKKGKGMELNTSCSRYETSMETIFSIIRRFKELGGEIITLGSDSHRVSSLGFLWQKAVDTLQAAGFQYVATFEKKEPVFHKL